GPHQCPAPDIGRTIAEVGVDALLMRLPDVELSVPEEELRLTESIASRHLVDLPVHFTPRPQQDVTKQPTHEHDTRVPQDWHITASRPRKATVTEADPG